MDIQKNNSIPQALKKLSQTTFVESLAAGDLNKAALSLPTTIKGAVGQPPICDIIKIVGQGKVVIFLKIELIKLSERISVGNNLTVPQMEFIATQLVEMFPKESIADFKLCFERGCMGQYGEIFRMDGIVLRKWMEQYLDEKYQLVEEELVKEKDNPYQPPSEVTDGPGRRLFDEYAKSLRMGNKVPGLTDADIKREGKEDAPRKTGTGHPRITEAGVEASQRQDLMREYGRHHTDIYTGKPLPGSPTFEQWVKEKQQEK